MSVTDGPSDRQLWRRACEGEPEAFGEVFDRHAKAVYNHCFRRTASWSMAEDLTSVVFLEAWRRRDAVQLHQDSALPWLLGIANKVIAHRRRSLRRHRATLARLPEPLDPPDLADQVAARVDDERIMSRLRAAIERLPRRDQEVLALCVYANLGYTGAAAALGVPVGTVRSRLSRARRRLADALATDQYPAFELREEAP